ncbi:response regulator [Rhodopirellula baltica]|uniref:Protein containing Signal transduction response regulator, receiver region domain protein n=1 Tax=Rhodopirellula baltica SWK14 TaxID=993516 RepID=L7CQ26_RHOBT|nr:response regulator [Rhodopirellula baltica]ELP35171.1 protein containing Signal transduction response regulator, receiver region domain protein [Rhodopirellula baltica SWK14]
MSSKFEVLSAEDDPDIQFAIEIVLTQAGYGVTKVSNGRELLHVAGATRPDMILLDLRMPIVSGQEALAILKEDVATESIPVVVLSASPGDCASMLDQGADFFFSKPFESQALLDAVDACKNKSDFH